jgi:hypothetical protein
MLGHTDLLSGVLGLTRPAGALPGLLLALSGAPASESSNGHAAAAATSQVSTPAFELTLRPSDTYASGKPSSVWIVLQARAPYHINQAYPYRFTPLDSEDIKYSAGVLDKSRAQVEEQRASIPIVLTPVKAGRLSVAGKFSFSVCTQDKCLMEKADLRVPIDVQ